MSTLVLVAFLMLMLVSKQATAQCPSGYNTGEYGMCWRMACDFVGYDIAREFGLSTGEQCGRLCYINPQCNHFTFNGHFEVCVMKRAPASHSRTESHHGIVCGYLPSKI
jgi:PAN domain